MRRNGHTTISVVMPVFNLSAYLPEAIESILAQTYQDFEFIIIDDGSTDGSGEIADAYSSRDRRIRVIHQPNAGISSALNAGLEVAEGEFIARMDGDDISMPERFARQLEFMQTHPEIGICGTTCRYFGNGRPFLGPTPPTDSEEVRCRLLFLPTLSHSTIFLRREFLLESNMLYDISLEGAEDYDLYVRSLSYTNITNIPDALVSYRIRQDSGTHTEARDGCRPLSAVHRRALSLIGISPSAEDLDLHLAISSSNFSSCYDMMPGVEHWLWRLTDANRKSEFANPVLLSDIVFEQWCNACILGPEPLTDKWRALRHSPLYLGDDALVRYAMSIGPNRAIRKLMKGRR